MTIRCFCWGKVECLRELIKIFSQYYDSTRIIAENLSKDIPDTLEGIWIDIATNNEVKALEWMDQVPKKNPFTFKYEIVLPETKTTTQSVVVKIH